MSNKKRHTVKSFILFLFNITTQQIMSKQAPLFCIDSTDTLDQSAIYTNGYDDNPACTPNSNSWDSGWMEFISRSCDSWFYSATKDEWLRVNPIFWNVKCNVAATQQETYIAKTSGGCSKPHTYQNTQYLQLTFYRSTAKENSSAAKSYAYFYFCKAFGVTQNNAKTASGGTSKQIYLNLCPGEQVEGYVAAYLGKLSDGLPSQFPDDWKSQVNGKTGVYLLAMQQGSPAALYINDGSSPETTSKRLGRMDYIDRTTNVLDPPIYKALDSKFWLRCIGLGGMILGVLFYYQYDKHKSKKSLSSSKMMQ
jgi:hypothetical protein